LHPSIECLRITEADGEKLTISALTEQCGFKSRTTLIAAFKKYEGMTPKEYLKTLKK